MEFQCGDAAATGSFVFQYHVADVGSGVPFIEGSVFILPSFAAASPWLYNHSFPEGYELIRRDG